MPKMTHATLSVQLKNLVENGLVERKQYDSVPIKVEYSLTEIGKEFRPVVDALQEWAEKYIEYMNNWQSRFSIYDITVDAKMIMSQMK